jgi:hypothetical protein
LLNKTDTKSKAEAGGMAEKIEMRSTGVVAESRTSHFHRKNLYSYPLEHGCITPKKSLFLSLAPYSAGAQQKKSSLFLSSLV